MVKQLSTAQLPTKFGDFMITVFDVDGEEVVLLESEPPKSPLSERLKIPLVRIHSSCLTGDVMGSLRCDCGEQRDLALTQISTCNGMLFYLFQEGRGIGLVEKIKAYGLQEEGYDTVEANEKLGHPIDARQFDQVAQILQFLEIPKIKLLTNNPEKVRSLEKAGIAVAEKIPLFVEPNQYNEKYLVTKQEKLGHTT